MKLGRPAACAIASVILLLGCTRTEQKRAAPLRPAQSLPGVAELERAHGLDAWKRHDALRAEIRVEFGGKTTLDGILTFTTDGTRSRIDLKDGAQLVFDGQRAWVAPDSATFEMARFHLLTWPYFLSVPFKLRDGGVRIGWMGDQPLGEAAGGKHYPALRLTFAPGTGDAPRDWYILYRDPQTDRLKAMAYIVTYGKAPADRPEDPHAITYDDFRTIDGVTLATRWTFSDWVPGKGISGDPVGRATLKNIQFIAPPPGFFEKPATGAREDALPAPK
jgi:hypothetical protein